MTEPAPDTWHHRDLPVLRTVVRLSDELIGMVPLGKVEEALPDLSPDDIQRAASALALGGYFTTTGAMGKPALRFKAVTEKARRAAGSWPTPETGVDRLIAALQEIAENGDTEDQRSRAQKALDALTGAGKQIAVSVASAVITGQVT